VLNPICHPRQNPGGGHGDDRPPALMAHGNASGGAHRAGGIRVATVTTIGAAAVATAIGVRRLGRLLVSRWPRMARSVCWSGVQPGEAAGTHAEPFASLPASS
jgi:hypothetical protein